MDNAELEIALEELESRLERLRALYEQYFMGIERIEPAIPRKDIDRRIYVLRREKIRNTAKRFKLQTIISRYNTFQQYWQRICREIEQGTYKRHVIKAERIAPGKLLTVAARKRLGRAALEAMETNEAAAEPAPSVAPSEPPSVEQALAAAAEPLTARAAPPPKPIAPPKPGARPAKPATAETAPKPAFESLDLDMDFLGDWDPSASAPKTTPANRPAPAPARPFGTPLSRPLNTPPPAPTQKAVAQPAAAPLPPLRAASGGPRPPIPAPLPSATGPTPAAAAPALPKPAPPAPPRNAPVSLGSAPPPKPVAAPPRPRASSPATGPSKPEAPPAPPPAGARPLAAPLPGATGIKPAAAPKPAPPKPAAPKPELAAAAPGPNASDARLRELHMRLVEAKRQTHDTANVSMEGLAKSMRAAEAKLREVHKNRTIDFDVVIKDGRAVLKPIVR